MQNSLAIRDRPIIPLRPLPEVLDGRLPDGLGGHEEGTVGHGVRAVHVLQFLHAKSCFKRC